MMENYNLKENNSTQVRKNGRQRLPRHKNKAIQYCFIAIINDTLNK